MWHNLRRCFAISSILVSGVSLALPDGIQEFAIALGISLNAVALFIKEEVKID